ncbi:MAG: S-formylglutathione hydrolase [Proteobacteria bacterium]|nr:S-formylglutathione hydrolase [Pseudomonadota bacterium]
METISEQRCFGGIQGFYQHDSRETATPMRFAVYQPPAAKDSSVPVLYYLAGLTCTEETATIKAGAQQLAAEHGLMLIMPDTSPRGAGIEGEDDDWDFGTAAGFYLDATASPWSKNYRMYSYVTEELRALINDRFNTNPEATGIFGHSMGGHGALTIALKNPEIYSSVSAFAPICAPTQCPWGEKAFSGYLGTDRQSWSAYDATELVKSTQLNSPILIDQGMEDGFLEEQLKPELFEGACDSAGQELTLRRHEGYDHSYYFIQSFMADHIAHHAAILSRL